MGAVIVTGAESGIGRATAVALAASGFDVGIAVQEDLDAAQATAGEVRAHGRVAGAEDVDPHGERRPGIPAGRPGDAREIAAAIAFLAGEGASYVTGHSFVVDGGMLLMAAMANQQLLDP